MSGRRSGGKGGLSPRAGGIVVTLGALSAFGPLSIDMYLPALPSMTRSLGST
ncbi:MAG: Bcr/CflA family drug resistance efflux transporter, partial [Rubrobacteraceae bacterium]|nr:Bcr/CflA family drug resistance efflux transporter [Rubrobacteraceae bacterium]